MGTSKAHLSLTVNTQKNFLSVGIYIPDNKDFYYELESNKSSIEQELGFTLDWRVLESSMASRIVYERHNIEFSDTQQWSEYQEWFKEKAEALQRVFTKYI